MREEVTLIFKDKTKFIWRTWKLGDARKAMKMQKKYGDPIDIIGDGVVAQTLRKKYVEYNENPSEYKSDVFGTASQLSGKAKQELKNKFDSVRRKLRFRKK